MSGCLCLFSPTSFSDSYGYHVSPRLPQPANKETAHWLSLIKTVNHWLLTSPVLPRPLSPRSLEEPGKEAPLGLPGLALAGTGLRQSLAGHVGCPGLGPEPPAGRRRGRRGQRG